MEKHARELALRADERLTAARASTVIGNVGVTPNTRFRGFLRDVARALASQGGAGPTRDARDMPRMSDTCLRASLHVALVIPHDRGNKRVAIDEDTNFTKLLAKRNSEADSYLFASKKLSKSERKGGLGAKHERVTTRSVDEDEKPIPKPLQSQQGASKPTTYATKAGAGAGAGAQGSSSLSSPSKSTQNGGGGGRSLGPLNSQARRSQRRERERHASDAASPSSAVTDVDRFARDKNRDPVVFPAFRRSPHGAIGDKFLPTSRERDGVSPESPNRAAGRR